MCDQIQETNLSGGGAGKKQKWTVIVLGICLALIIVSVFFCSLIQTAGFKAKVTDLRDETNRGTISLTATDKDAAANYTVSGKVTSGILMVPKNATKDTPAPAVVLTHGLYNNREMQLQNAIELVRRGYVVLTIDRAQHGHNETASDSPYGQPMLDAAKYLYNLPCVDKERIGVTGHSMGGSATNNALAIDGVDTASFRMTSNGASVTIDAGQTDAALKAGYHMGIISAGLTQANNAASALGSNLLGVGILKASSDEFFFSNTQKEKTYVPVNKDSVTEDNYTNYYLLKKGEYVKQTEMDRYKKNAQYYNFTATGNSTMYLTSKQAVTFVGQNPDALEEWNVINGGIYNGKTGELLAQPDGKKKVSVAVKGAAFASDTVSIRAIYEARETHPMNHFSTKSAANLVDFFYNVFGTPEGVKYIAPTNQTWWLKEMFSLFGFLGLFGMLFPLTDLLLGTRLFASLKGEPAEAPMLLTKPRKHVSYWLGGILTAWFGAYSLQNINANGNWYSMSGFNGLFATSEGYIWANIGPIAFWGLCCAAFAIAITGIIWLINRVINVFIYNDDYLAYDEHPFDGFKIRSFKNVLKTPLLAVILVGIFYGVVQIIWSATVVDFRIWTFDIKVFNFDRIVSYLKYAAIFFVFYMVSAAFSQNYRVKDLPEWATIAINVVFNVIGILILFAVQNSYFIRTGALIDSANKLFYIACYPIIPCVAIATVVARRMYVRTGNAWLAGIVNALIMTIIACANTSMAGGTVSWFYGA